MSLTTQSLSKESASSELASCFHCGLPVPTGITYQTQFNQHAHAVCCVGCQAVAESIINAGLGHYYTERTSFPISPSVVNESSGVSINPASFDLPKIQAQYASPVGFVANFYQSELEHDARNKSALLTIGGVTCNACLWLAESAISKVPGVISAEINYVTHRATVIWRSQHTSLSAIVDAVIRVGLQVSPIASRQSLSHRLKAKRELLKQLGVALLAMMQVMMFTVPLYFTDAADVSIEALHLMQWVSFLLTLPVVAYSARPFWLGAMRDLRTRHISMDSPIALAIVTTFVSSVWAFLQGQPGLAVGQSDLYFDSIIMFVFLLLASRYLELLVRDQALSQIERLTNASPAVASRLTHYPETRDLLEVACADLAMGDIVLISTGQIIPADAVLVEGAAEIDESIVTGESRPVTHSVGDELVGGTLNVGGPLIARVERVGESSLLAGIARLAERSLGERPRLAALTDRVARVVTPLLIVVSGLAGFIWLFIDPSQSFSVAVAVLAVTCPCAIALAAPMAYSSATLTTVKRGLLIARGHVLEALPQITDVVFDKTGTLTTGNFEIENIETSDVMLGVGLGVGLGVRLGNNARQDALVIAAALELGAAHPIASAIHREQQRSNPAPLSTKPIIASQLRMVPGGGVEGVIELNGQSDRYRFGHRRFACEVDVLKPWLDQHEGDTSKPWLDHHEGDTSKPWMDQHEDAFVLSRNGEWLATFHVKDSLKADAFATVQALKQSGLRVHLLSGDRKWRVTQVADELGIDPALCASEQSPQQKHDYVALLRSKACSVLMLGDGVNDAPVLAAANVSIAMVSGADLPRLTADAVLLSPKLACVSATICLAQRTRHIIRQNFTWAVVYNLIAIPLAVANLINPAVAAIGMGASGLAVVLNSMRLLRRGN